MKQEDLELPLSDLAQRIESHAAKSDEHVLKAAALIVEAKRRVDDGEIADVTWADWSRENLALSPSRIKELVRIGSAKDPAAALAGQREQTKARVQAHRAKAATRTSNDSEMGSADEEAKGDDASKAESAAPVETDGDGESAAAPRNISSTTQAPISGVAESGALEAARAELIDWAQAAPIEAVNDVRDYVHLNFGLTAKAAPKEIAA